MEYIKISLNLLYYYNDHRQLTRLFISDDMPTIGDLENHISNMFNIDNFYLMCENHYLPSSEDIRILNYDDVIYVTPAYVSNDVLIEKKIKESEHQEEEEVIKEIEPVNIAIKTKKKRRRVSLSNDTTIEEINYKKEKKKKKKLIVEQVTPEIVVTSKKEKRKQRCKSMEISDGLEQNTSTNNSIMHLKSSQWDSKDESKRIKSGDFIINPKTNSKRNPQNSNITPIIHSVKIINTNKECEANLSVTEKINLFESKSPTNITISKNTLTPKNRNGNSSEASNRSTKISPESISSTPHNKTTPKTTTPLKNSPHSVSSQSHDETTTSNKNSQSKNNQLDDCISVGENLLKHILSKSVNTNSTESLNNSDSFNNFANENVTKRRRVRTRKRKRPSDVTITETVDHVTFRPLKTRAAPTQHIKFNDDENDINPDMDETNEYNSTNKVNNSTEFNTETSKVKLYHSTPYVKDDPSLNTSQSFDESSRNITDNISINSTKHNAHFRKPDPMNFPLLTGNVTKSNLIFFKKLKIGPNYTPEISNYIFAQVEEVSADGNQLVVKVLDGHKEFDEPVGKFSCISEDGKEDESFETNNDSVCIDRASMIEPRVMKIATVRLTKGNCE